MNKSNGKSHGIRCNEAGTTLLNEKKSNGPGRGLAASEGETAGARVFATQRMSGFLLKASLGTKRCDSDAEHAQMKSLNIYRWRRHGTTTRIRRSTRSDRTTRLLGARSCRHAWRKLFQRLSAHPA